jgi:hypothetical protein
MKIKLIIKKYSQVFNRVSTGYTGLKKIIFVDHYNCFPKEDYNYSSISTEFHTVHIAPTS